MRLKLDENLSRHLKDQLIALGHNTNVVETLVSKLRALPPERLVEVEDFVDFLRVRDDDRRLVMAASRLSEAAFAEVWDKPDDAAYDKL